MQTKITYNVHGLSCANCAKQFEDNVKKLPGIVEANVNFNTSKISLVGDVSIQDVQKAGAFENLKVYPENEVLAKTPFWRNTVTIRTILSGILFLLGCLLYLQLGETSPAPIIAFVASMVVGGYLLFYQGFRNLLSLKFDMKTLMTIAVIGAAAIGEWGEGAAVVFLFAISEALEGYSMNKARQSIRSLMQLAPKEATVVRNNQEQVLHVEEIELGDILLVKPGQKIALDGKVLSGHSSVNQAAITGESIPVYKAIDDEVYAGTLNEEGHLEVLVTKRYKESTLAKIIHLVEEAQSEKAPTQAFIDRFAKYYTPLVLVIALAIVTVPPLFLGGSWQEWLYRGLAMLVVACPCALIISTPVAIVTAIGAAARNGVLIKGGNYLEEIGRINTIAFDKTGTLTKGEPEVTNILAYDQGLKQFVHDQSTSDWYVKAAALERLSQHPLAKAIVQRAERAGANLLNHQEIEDFESITGKGIKGTIANVTYYVGSPGLFTHKHKEFLTSAIVQQVESLQNEGNTVILVGTDHEVLGIIALRDEARAESMHIVSSLKQLGISKQYMLTGDNRKAAAAIASRLGMTNVFAELLPEEKLTTVKTIQAQGERVAMIGDGVNDAPALVQANVGIAMGGAGTDTALETADIVLMSDDLDKLPYLIGLSRKALRVIKQNIMFAFGIKILALLLIIPGFLTLWMAIFADMGATLLVTLNSIRLIRNDIRLKRILQAHQHRTVEALDKDTKLAN